MKKEKGKNVFIVNQERFKPCLQCGTPVSLRNYASVIAENKHKIVKPFHPECLPLYLRDHPEIPAPAGFSFEEKYAICLACGEPVLKERGKQIDDGYVHAKAKCILYYHVR